MSSEAADEDEPTWCEIVTALPPAHRRKILDYLVSVSRPLVPPPTRPQRIAARDRAIRRAIVEHYRDDPPTVGAKALAAALKRYEQGEFRHGSELLASASTHRRALHSILTLNSGKPLAWRRIAEIC